MIILFFTFILLISKSFGCERTLKTENTGKNHNPNATIVCSNIYSIEEIYFKFDDIDVDQVLQITNSNVTTLKENDFQKFHSIAKLFLSEIYLKEIQLNAFSGLKNLEELYLDNNEITKISKNIFASLNQLKLLDLSHNKIVQIEEGGFKGLNALTDLFLQDNALVKLEETVFSDLTHLKNLNLSSNPLETIPTTDISSLNYFGVGNTSIKEFGFLKNLKVDILNLALNHFKSFDFSTMPNLTRLDLTHNELESLENIQLLRAKRITLNFNRIKKINSSLKDFIWIEASNNELDRIDKTFFGVSQMTRVVDFSHNKISTIESDSFQGLGWLGELYLQNNNISNIEVDLFKDFFVLEILDLSYNQIKSIQNGTFSGTRSLRFLDLSYNKLTKLENNMFNSSLFLGHLNISHNQISTLDPENLLKHVLNLVEVSLDGNNWNCKELNQIGKFLYKKNVKIAEAKSFDVDNFYGIACKNDHLQQSTSNISFTAFIQSFQNAINNTFQSSKLKKFFNEDFEKSHFVKFFKENYHSNFEKNFNLKQSQKKWEDSEEEILLVVSVSLQVIMCLILFVMAYFMFIILKDGRENRSGTQKVELDENQ